MIFQTVSQEVRPPAWLLSVLQHDTGPLADGGLRVEKGPHRLCEHILDTVLVQSRTLQVSDGMNLASERGALLLGHWCLVLILQLLLDFSVVPEVALCANQEDGDAGTVVGHLGCGRYQ